MGHFSKALIEVRKKHFASSAKKAWFEWNRKGLEINYAYYMRLEQGKVLPSAQVVSRLKKIISIDDGEKLIKAYCTDLFPDESYLFQSKKVPDVDSEALREEQRLFTKQKSLSERQISLLAKEKGIYHLFLMLTLSRRSISKVELKEIFASDDLTRFLKVLVSEGLAIETFEGIENAFPEVSFPKATNESLRQYYTKFDSWDLEFGKAFKLDNLFRKMILRRVSYRYLNLIQRNLEFIVELSKSSDETEKRHNDSVIQLQIILNQGKIPG